MSSASTLLELVATSFAVKHETSRAAPYPINNVNLQWDCPNGEAQYQAHITARTHGYSQSGEDVTVARCLFCDVCSRSKRTYVELGALQGTRYSNTLFWSRD